MAVTEAKLKLKAKGKPLPEYEDAKKKSKLMRDTEALLINLEKAKIARK